MKISVDIEEETLDNITVAGLVEAHGLVKDGWAEDDDEGKLLEALQTVLEYYGVSV